MAPALDAMVSLASGVPLLVLGALLLAPKPRRAPQVFFAAFALLWGVQVVAANAGRVLDAPPVHHVGMLASFAVQPPAYLFLTHLAARWTGERRAWIATAAMGTVAVAAALTLALAPRLVVQDVAMVDGVLTTTLGPAVTPLFGIPFFGAFYLAIGALYLQYRRAAPGSQRSRARGLLLALALFTSYLTTWSLFIFLGNPRGLHLLGSFGTGGLAALFVAGALFLAGLLAHALLRPPPPEERDYRLAAAFLVPVAARLLESAVGATRGVETDSLGLWRLATVAAVGYALARHQLFDLDLKLKRVAGPMVAALALGFGTLGTLFLTVADDGSSLLPLVAGVAVAGAAYARRDAVGRLLFPGVTDEPEYLYQRKLEVYRSYLEKALAEGAPTDTPALRALRERLDLSDREHGIMVFLLRQPAAPAPAAASERLAPGARLLGRYRVDRLLGEGAHGRTWLAYDERAGRDVAVKAVGHNAFGGRAAALLLREARLLQGLRNPHVVAVHDVAESPHEALLVMEYADGGNLHGLLARRGPLPFDEATRILDEMLQGLEAAHAVGIVHRDVKPENVLLTRAGAVKLADFGVAREARPEGTAMEAPGTALTAGAAAGTLLYMSPEQVRAVAVDARSDLYAAAVVYHQLLTGKFYLRIAGKDDFQVRQLILHGEPHLALRDAPQRVAPFLLKALAKDPAERFQTAGEMRAALAGLTEARPPATPGTLTAV